MTTILFSQNFVYEAKRYEFLSTRLQSQDMKTIITNTPIQTFSFSKFDTAIISLRQGYNDISHGLTIAKTLKKEKDNSKIYVEAKDFSSDEISLLETATQKNEINGFLYFDKIEEFLLNRLKF